MDLSFLLLAAYLGAYFTKSRPMWMVTGGLAAIVFVVDVFAFLGGSFAHALYAIITALIAAQAYAQVTGRDLFAEIKWRWQRLLKRLGR